MILGRCRLCGRAIHYLVDFSTRHMAKCRKRHNDGVNKIVSKIRRASEFGGDLHNLEKEIWKIARSSYIKQKKFTEHVFKGWELAAGELLKNGLPSALAEKNLLAALDHFPMPKKKVRDSQTYRNLKHLPFLRDVSAGLYPSVQATDNVFCFNLLISEKMVRVFANVEYYEEVTRTEIEYDTNSSGSNQDRIRTVGRQINKTSIERIDSGAMGLSTMHIYFAGDRRRFRIPYHRIAVLNRDYVRLLGFKVSEEVINITQDGQHAIPQQFRLNNAWLAYNLILILTRQ